MAAGDCPVISFTITPISANPKANANRDFQEQLERNSQIIDGDMFWNWDDSKYNTSQEGDLFAFFHTKSKLSGGKASLTFHRILRVKDPKHRLPSWGKNIGQSDRNVLELSPPIETFTLEEWQTLNGHFAHRGCCNGTTRAHCSISERPLLYKMLSRL
jgi:hypothetical protein